jgi:myosin heavy subunit
VIDSKTYNIIYRSLVKQAFDVLLLSEDQQQNIFLLLAGILHLGDLQYAEDTDGGQEGSQVTNTDVLKLAAGLLDLDSEQLGKVLVSRQMVSRG